MSGSRHPIKFSQIQKNSSNRYLFLICSRLPKTHEHLSLMPEMIRKHVSGASRMGIFPHLAADLTAWVASDLDNHDGQRDPSADVRRITEAGAALEIPVMIFSSNSGGGFHGYLFFDQPIPAVKARSLMLGLIERAGVDISNRRDKTGSFDCIFPKQDTLQGGPGNLIALPWNGRAFKERKSTLYLDSKTHEPAGESFTENLDAFEEDFRAMTEADVDALLKEMGINPTSASGRATPARGSEKLGVLIDRCAFLSHCRDDAATLREPEWYAAICLLVREYCGAALIHALSKPHPGYSYRETQEKIEHALHDQPGPLTCTKIREFWNCGRECGVTSPVHLLRRRAAGSATDSAAAESPGTDAKEPPSNKPRPRESERLVELAGDIELFHDAESRGYATVPLTGHRETVLLRGQALRDWLVRGYYLETGKPPGKQAVSDAVALLEAKARFDGPEHEVFLRVGALAGAVYIDLCTRDWQCARITAEGWDIVGDVHVKFRRSPAMKSLPLPERGGSFTDLQPFVNTDEDGFKVIVAWLVGALNPKGPYPVLAIEGEAGAGKSGVARLLRSLVDPAVAPLRSLPKEERDLAIAGSNGWGLVFDNVSALSLEMSDALCRLATGAGFATRELFTNDAEAVFGLTRPIVLNGITRVATRGDLLNRALVVTLAPISPEARRTETELQEAFDLVRPRILGALFDAVAAALRNLPAVKLPRLLRMADFCKWILAAEEALPWAPGEFIEAYAGNAFEAATSAIEADLIASAVCELLEACAAWRGTPAALLDALDGVVDDRIRKLERWPKRADSLSRRLRRLAPLLRSVGIEVLHSPRTHNGRFLELHRAQEHAPNLTPPSSCSHPDTEEAF